MTKREVTLHLMACEHKEVLSLDEEKPVKQLFDDILAAGTPELRAKVKEQQMASGQPAIMILFCNGQQLASSSPDAAPAELKSLSHIACFPKENVDGVLPTLQLYIPKHYHSPSKPAESRKVHDNKAQSNDCCVIA